jgi:hypothetical protein
MNARPRIAMFAAVLGLAPLLPRLERAARASVEHDSDRSEGAFNVARLAFDGTVAAGDDRFVLVEVTTSDGALPVASASLGGVPLGFISGVTAPEGHCRVEWWGLVAPAPGTQPLIVDLPAPAAHLGAVFISYRGVSPVAPVAGATAATGSAGPTEVTIAGAGAGDVVLDAVCAWSADSVIATAGSNQVARWHWSTGSLSSAGSELPGAASVTLTWTADGPANVQWGAVGLALQAADGVAGRYPVRVDLGLESAGCALGHNPGRLPAPGSAVAGIILGLGLVFLARRAGTKPGRSR